MLASWGGRHPFYLLADSPEGQQREAKITRQPPSTQPTSGSIRQGFVYERVPHITLKSIANNAEIDVIYKQFQEKLEPLCEQLNASLDESWEDWEIPREAGEDWSSEAKRTHADWWERRIARQEEIDASISAKADFEFLYDRPYEDKSKVRVAGPFTVESISPHRVLGVGPDDELIDPFTKVAEESDPAYGGKQQDFASIILENLRTAGVHQTKKAHRITFTSLNAIPGGDYICAEGRYSESDSDDAPERRAGIFIGPEFGTVSRPDLVAAAREAGDMGYDVLIACAFNYDAHSSEFEKLGALPVLKARMNADLHMAGDLKNTGKGNLFVIFGEPDIRIFEGGSDELKQILEDRSKAIPSDTTAIEEHREELKKRKKELKDFKKKKDEDKTSSCGERILSLEKAVAAAQERIVRNTQFVEEAPKISSGQIMVELYGVDIFKPSSGEVISGGPDDIACWFLDTDYNEESFFVRHAYFLGQSDPYKSLRTTLKAEIDEEAWSSLNRDVSRPFPKPSTGRIAVKVINHLGDEVMKVFNVG